MWMLLKMAMIQKHENGVVDDLEDREDEKGIGYEKGNDYMDEEDNDYVA